MTLVVFKFAIQVCYTSLVLCLRSEHMIYIIAHGYAVQIEIEIQTARKFVSLADQPEFHEQSTRSHSSLFEISRHHSRR
jgi:hypothetical protein